MDMTLVELEQKLARMREQGAVDTTPVKIIAFGGSFGGSVERIFEVGCRNGSGPMGKRVVELSSEKGS